MTTQAKFKEGDVLRCDETFGAFGAVIKIVDVDALSYVYIFLSINNKPPRKEVQDRSHRMSLQEFENEYYRIFLINFNDIWKDLNGQISV